MNRVHWLYDALAKKPLAPQHMSCSGSSHTGLVDLGSGQKLRLLLSAFVAIVDDSIIIPSFLAEFKNRMYKNLGQCVPSTSDDLGQCDFNL